MCQQHKFQLARTISKRFIRTHCFYELHPGLRGIQLCFHRIEKKQKKQTKKTPERDTYSRSHLRPLLGWQIRFSPLSTFFSLVSSRAFRGTPHSRFKCEDSNQYLSSFLEMLLLALPQIFTRVFYLWKSIDFDSTWVRNSRLYQLSFLS